MFPVVFSLLSLLLWFAWNGMRLIAQYLISEEKNNVSVWIMEEEVKNTGGSRIAWLVSECLALIHCWFCCKSL